MATIKRKTWLLFTTTRKASLLATIVTRALHLTTCPRSLSHILRKVATLATVTLASRTSRASHRATSPNNTSSAPSRTMSKTTMEQTMATAKELHRATSLRSNSTSTARSAIWESRRGSSTSAIASPAVQSSMECIPLRADSEKGIPIL